MTRPLSPAAQAVVNAATLAYLRSPGVTLEPALAAALRAAADATVPDEPEPLFHATEWVSEREYEWREHQKTQWMERQQQRRSWLHIANELDPS